MKKILVIILALTLTCGTTAYADGAMKKLGRGLTNVFTGWMEIFLTPHKNFIDNDEDALAALGGIPEGFAKAVFRTATGAYETLTFPVPYPENYAPIIDPPYILEPRENHFESVESEKGCLIT